MFLSFSLFLFRCQVFFLMEYFQFFSKISIFQTLHSKAAYSSNGIDVAKAKLIKIPPKTSEKAKLRKEKVSSCFFCFDLRKLSPWLEPEKYNFFDIISWQMFLIYESVSERKRERERVRGDKEELVNMIRPNKTCETFH